MKLKTLRSLFETKNSKLKTKNCKGSSVGSFRNHGLGHRSLYAGERIPYRRKIRPLSGECGIAGPAGIHDCVRSRGMPVCAGDPAHDPGGGHLRTLFRLYLRLGGGHDRIEPGIFYRALPGARLCRVAHWRQAKEIR